ncbi:unnamed protein product [Paramecium sonneborni]|uniref:Uncharacterized protein n=1 Tax=Paramecium sonneborni TaxID=65129 RepID=A0A8S1NKB0_9CILI|nr:unnamed protein product [Paramecium sonneborni]
MFVFQLHHLKILMIAKFIVLVVLQVIQVQDVLLFQLNEKYLVDRASQITIEGQFVVGWIFLYFKSYLTASKCLQLLYDAKNTSHYVLLIIQLLQMQNQLYKDVKIYICFVHQESCWISNLHVNILSQLILKNLLQQLIIIEQLNKKNNFNLLFVKTIQAFAQKLILRVFALELNNLAFQITFKMDA